MLYVGILFLFCLKSKNVKVIFLHPNIYCRAKDFNFRLSCCFRGSINYEVNKIQKEEWLKSLKLEEDKILDDEEYIYPFEYNAFKTLDNRPVRV